MDHNEAMRLQAAEKYVLGKLPREQHAEYEEHYFDCSACAEEIKATVAFMEGARQVVREEALEPVGARVLAPAVPGFFSWLRPAFVVPVFAALLVFIAYQNSVTIPGLRQSLSRTAIAEVAKSFSLVSLGARGEGSSSLKIGVGPREDFNLVVDMPGNSPTGYTCQIQEESGKTLVTLPVSSEEAKSTVTLIMRGGSLQPGKYNFLIFTGEAPTAQTADGHAAAREPFVIEFVQ
jgi:hypothetical protein